MASLLNHPPKGTALKANTLSIRTLFETFLPFSGKRPFMVLLCASGNPDHAQFAPVASPELAYTATREALVAPTRAYIQRHNLGAGNWGPDSGKVFDALQSRVTHRIAYNSTFVPVPEGAAAQHVEDHEGSGLDALCSAGRGCR